MTSQWSRYDLFTAVVGAGAPCKGRERIQRHLPGVEWAVQEVHLWFASPVPVDRGGKWMRWWGQRGWWGEVVVERGAVMEWRGLKWDYGFEVVGVELWFWSDESGAIFWWWQWRYNFEVMKVKWWWRKVVKVEWLFWMKVNWCCWKWSHNSKNIQV